MYRALATGPADLKTHFLLWLPAMDRPADELVSLAQLRVPGGRIFAEMDDLPALTRVLESESEIEAIQLERLPRLDRTAE